MSGRTASIVRSQFFAFHSVPALTSIFRALAFEAVADHEKGFFTARHKIIATLRGRLRSLPLAPNNVIAFLLA
jgi:hypothetical protein